MLKKLLFKIARKDFMGKFVGLIFSKLSWLLPVRKVYENNKIVAFYHPVPSYKTHILIIPKKIIKTLSDFKSENDIKILIDIITNSLNISKDLYINYDSVALCANAGKRQDVKQVHFHLFNANIMNIDLDNLLNLNASKHSKNINIRYTLKKDSKLIITISLKSTNTYDYENLESLLKEFINILPIIDYKFHLTQNGYSFIMQYNKSDINNCTNKIYITSNLNS